MSQWESWVERQIREATERGEFDNLPGMGKPLDLSDASDPDWWIKRYVAREGIDASEVVHPTLALRREAAGYPAALVDVPTEESVREIIHDYNLRVIEDRRRPVRGAAMPPVARRLDPDEMVAAWRELRATQSRASTGGHDAGEHPARQAPEQPAHHAARGRFGWWRLSDWLARWRRG